MEDTLSGAREEECQLKRDTETKSLEVRVVESQVEVKSKALADLEATPTSCPDDVMELERHEHVMLDMQSSFNPDMWMDSVWACS